MNNWVNQLTYYLVNDLFMSSPKKPHIKIDAIDVSKIADIRSRLQKNEFTVTSYNDDTIRFDFGRDVPLKLRKRAIRWAKQRGLRVVEVPLEKHMINSNVAQIIVCSCCSLNHQFTSPNVLSCIKCSL